MPNNRQTFALPESFTTKVDDRYLTGYDNNGRKTGPRLRETRVGAVSLYGTKIPISSGLRPGFGNIIWSAPLIENEYIVSGQLRYEYSGTFAIDFGAPVTPSTVTNLVAVWLDGQLVYDIRKTNRIQAKWFDFDFYPGSETQVQDPTIAAIEGLTSTSANRGHTYMVVKDLPLGPYDNKLPAVKVLLSDNAVSADITSMAATDSASNTGGMVDWTRGRYYVLNSLGSKQFNLYTFDLAADPPAFLESKPLHNVGDNPGVDNATTGSITVIPWLNRLAMTDGNTAVDNYIHLINPDTGRANSNLAQINQHGFLVPHYVDTPFGRFTYLLCDKINNARQADVIQIAPNVNGDPYFMSRVAADLVFPSPASATDNKRIVPGRRTDTFCEYYFATEGEDDVHRLTITPALIGIDDDGAFVIEDTVFENPSGAGTSTIRGMSFEYSTDALIVIYADGFAQKWDVVNDVILWEIDDLDSPPPDQPVKWHEFNISAGYLGYVGVDSDLHVIDLLKGTEEIFSGSAGTIGQVSQLFSSQGDMMIGLGTSSGVAHVNKYRKLGSGRPNLKDLIGELAEAAGYQNSEITLDSSVDDQIDGFLTDQGGTLSEILGPIRNVYNLDIIESGANLKLLARAKGSTSPDFTITEDDILELGGSKGDFNVELTEEQAIPSRVNVTYWEPGLAYNHATQTAFRSGTTRAVDTEGQIDYNLPLVISGDEAKYGAYNTLYNPWISQTTVAFKLPPEYMRLEPGDVIQATYFGQTHLLKCIDWEMDPDYNIVVAAEAFQNFEDFTMSAFIGTPYEQDLPDVLDANLVRLYVIDSYPIQDSDDTAGFTATSETEPSQILYCVATPGTLTNTFEGAEISYGYGIRNTKNVPPEDSFTSSTIAVPAGTVLTNMYMPTRPFGFDEFEEITVAIEVGDTSLLTSLTSHEEIFTGNGNLAAVGRNGRWELIQFDNVNDNGDGTFTLTGILRGVKHSDWIWEVPPETRSTGYSSSTIPRITDRDYAADPNRIVHNAGQTNFVLLSSSWVSKVYVPVSKFAGNQNTTFFTIKASGQGRSVLGYLQYTTHGIGMLPPVIRDIKVYRNQDGRYQVSFNRRYRLTSTLHDGDGDTPLSPYESEYFWVDMDQRYTGNPSQGVILNATTTETRRYGNDGTTPLAEVVNSDFDPLVPGLVNSLTQTYQFDDVYTRQMWGTIYEYYVDDVLSVGPLTHRRFGSLTPSNPKVYSDENQVDFLTNVGDSTAVTRMSHALVRITVTQAARLQELSEPGLFPSADDMFNDWVAGESPYATLDQLQAGYSSYRGRLAFGFALEKDVWIEETS